MSQAGRLPNGQRSPAAAHDRTSGRLVQRVLDSTLRVMLFERQSKGP